MIVLDTHVLLWADRFIVATALVHGAALVTADQRLLDWCHGLERHDARE